ncbi:dihydroxyacetone kinase subunit L [Amycolatopsis rubida]|uniref:Dihydroxyacetone kinase subunit L n=1 Tax=Amycolatopsis rubida TaxID=112413 RepID=A0A1I5IPD3_9PSEU|nr:MULTISPECIES: dihydroxyacetone kinase subunit DhaL [Amycolatopsis]MYW92388.1 dihydroxyacetone kinase subunit L [Amycolatopsis rubida]NEC57376.1 dihydroxyacetone kinase subunit L [Amycolatopsis rubida]OAP20689.1 PTS-dependent dihydroxyacetone kinase, ADP-binding subunit DhaL [Amycolatopsis sp. M39]SFO62293.1 dihydroxyacetone kinase, C-terminal domain [Amycolatopsis rubida]
MACTAEGVAAALRAAAEVIAEHRTELVDLDRAIGDADHGENLSRGFTAIVSALETAVPETPAGVVKLAATTLISKVGGAAGPLYGTAFLRASAKLGDAAEIDVPLLLDALRAALEGVRARGKAAGGDATMVDALIPAVSAAEGVADGTIADVLTAAADGADRGAESTVDLIPRKGRASYLGERAVGHMDPGARSTALLLRAFAEAAR